MKIDRFVYSTDENPEYMNSWPLVSMVTKKIFGCKVSLAFITNRNEDELIVKMRKFGEVFLFKTIDGIPVGNQAKASRMFLATLYPEEICVINDVDLLPLQKDFLVGLLDGLPDDYLVTVGRNAYHNSLEEGKFPMIYTSAKGKIFKEIINPNNLGYIDTLGQWMHTNVIDHKEAISKPFTVFSDESLLRALIYSWKNKHRVVYLDRPDFVGMRETRRIDRANWHIDKTMLNN